MSEGLGRGSSPTLATRVRKARFPSRCALDGCPIRIGDPIGLLPALGWAAAACILERQRKTRTETITEEKTS